MDIDEKRTANSKALADTLEHIRHVGQSLSRAAYNLFNRAIKHDHSKFSPEEWPYFSQIECMDGIKYGTPEYKAALAKIRPGVDHHQKVNKHHPEFYENGISGMSLFDLVEMLCDWKAAISRNKDGDILRSLEYNSNKWKMPAELELILKNTIREMGWDEDYNWEKLDELSRDLNGNSFRPIN